MHEFIYRYYGYAHKFAKGIINKQKSNDNPNANKGLKLLLGVSGEDSPNKWWRFISNSLIPQGEEHSGTHYAGFIADTAEWCLPSWIWTNAAIVRVFCEYGKIKEAKEICSLLMNQQLTCGGWIVRNDYDKDGPIPILAPNDSAYIANNAFIKLYETTGESLYLDVAKQCADWIIDTARPDGMVYLGYDVKRNRWCKDIIIVDVGFTAGLFAKLYEYTKNQSYKVFLEKFVNQYIQLFFNPSRNGFATSINQDNSQVGGIFGRGQAWALEGLIPAYQVLKSKEIRDVILIIMDNLLHVQEKDGGWPYNFTKKLMGTDCKAVSVIAKNMMDWYKIEPDERIKSSANKALEWCRKHTSRNEVCNGGIFSYCLEGAIVQNLYSSCAFVYASVYAIELQQMLES